MGSLLLTHWEPVCRKTRQRCYYCGWKQARIVRPGEGLTIDHVVPRSAGGSDDLDNLVPACRTCNSIKGKRSIDEARHSFALAQLGWPPFTRDMIAWMTQRGFDLRPYFEHKLWFERRTFVGTSDGGLDENSV